jgi:uncharacterized protein YbjT (DUF2867 family)
MIGPIPGATGTVGREVVAQLVSAGLPGRALTRDPAKVLFDPKVGVVQADLATPETLAKALSGVERVMSPSRLARVVEITNSQRQLASVQRNSRVPTPFWWHRSCVDRSRLENRRRTW